MQEELRPILLRRMKEDVEDLPQKEEIVVRVQLTQQQRSFYKAIFAKQACSRCSHPSSTSTVPAAQQLPACLHKSCLPLLVRGERRLILSTNTQHSPSSRPSRL